MAAQILPHFTPSEETSPSLLYHITTLGSSTLNWFFSFWSNYLLIVTPFYPFWSNYSLTPTPFNPLAAQLSHHFTPSEHYTQLIWLFTPLAAQLIPHFNAPKVPPPHSYTILNPLAAQLLHHFRSYPLTLKTFYPFCSSTPISIYSLLTNSPHSYNNLSHWQPNSYINLPPLNKISPYFHINLPHRQITTNSYNQNGRILGSTFETGSQHSISHDATQRCFWITASKLWYTPVSNFKLMQLKHLKQVWSQRLPKITKPTQHWNKNFSAEVEKQFKLEQIAPSWSAKPIYHRVRKKMSVEVWVLRLRRKNYCPFFACNQKLTFISSLKENHSHSLKRKQFSLKAHI